MLAVLARNWWVLALRGVLAVIFGILTIIWTDPTLLVLITLFGAYALVDGIFAVVAGIASRGENQRWWAMVLEGVAGIILGLVTFRWPGTTALPAGVFHRRLGIDHKRAGDCGCDSIAPCAYGRMGADPWRHPVDHFRPVFGACPRRGCLRVDLADRSLCGGVRHPADRCCVPFAHPAA